MTSSKYAASAFCTAVYKSKFWSESEEREAPHEGGVLTKRCTLARSKKKTKGPPRSRLSISFVFKRPSRIPLERLRMAGRSIPNSAVHCRKLDVTGPSKETQKSHRGWSYQRLARLHTTGSLGDTVSLPQICWVTQRRLLRPAQRRLTPRILDNERSTFWQ